MQRNIFVLATLWGLSPFLACAMGTKLATFEVHGHRGARALEPENTFPAFVHAYQNGANVLEADLGVTSDGHLVLNHDFEVNAELCRSSDAKLRRRHAPLVNSLTLKQVETYDCGSAYDPNFPRRQLRPGQKILRFDHFLTWFKKLPSKSPGACPVKLNLEIKIEAARPRDTLQPKAFVDLVIAALRKNKVSQQCVILQSFDFRTLRYAKSKYHLTTSALVESLSEGYELDVTKIQSDSGHADYLSPDASLLSRSKVRTAQNLGMKVVPWTLNKRSHWGHFVNIGVDGIISDDPQGLVRYLRSRAAKTRARARP